MQVVDLLQQNSSWPEVLDGDNVENDPVNMVDPWGLAPGDGYPTADAAALAAAADIRGMANQGVEYGGWIYTQVPETWLYGGDEAYHTYTAPRTDNQKDRVSPGPRPCGGEADYHSHPRIPGYKYNQFSDDDTNMNDELGISGYLLTPDRGLLRYNPGQRPVRVR